MNLKPFEIFNIENPENVCQVPEGVCLLAYRGSIAHGIYVPSNDPTHIDDVDLMGIVLAPAKNYIGLSEWGSRGTYEWKRGRWDCVYYEIRKMFSLLLQGNPNVLSMLWCKRDHYLYRNQISQRIIDNRNLFIGKHVYNAFAGYAHAQLEKMETQEPVELRKYMAVTYELKARGCHPNHKGEAIPYPDNCSLSFGELADAHATSTDKLLGQLRHFQKKGENIGYLGDKRKQLVLEHGYDSKNAAHCIRLLRMCCEFLGTGEMQVYRQDAVELLQIKKGEWALEKIKEYSRQLFDDIRVARDASTLPESPDTEGAEALLISILREYLLSGINT